jgi:16S rRNA (cytosine967-C5)-methyltransferase
LTVELTYGVLRRLSTLDWRLQPVAAKPLPRLPIMVQMILRLGAYQCLFLDRIPVSAAVDESVRLAKLHQHILKKDWSGFVNAVLRSLLRQSAPPLPEVDREPAKALAIRHAMPEWLAARWIERLGISAAALLCERSSAVPPVSLRVNRLKTTPEALLQRFAEEGLVAKPSSVSPVGVILQEGGVISSLPGFEEGTFYVEDEAAQLIPPLVDPRPGDRVLDACAAPGGKTTHLAELMENRGSITAVDRKEVRLAKLKRNCARLGISIVDTVAGDARQLPRSLLGVRHAVDENQAVFDRILVDAPCSGLGVLRRHPEAKWRKEPESFLRHQALQLQILHAVAPCLRPGGVLVYSTCSTEREENEDVVDQFCRTHAGFCRESVSPWLPVAARRFLTEQGDLSTRDNRESMDGFYAARLKKDE